jgi:5'-nucleotidase
VNEDRSQDTDEYALANNFVSIVPCQYDLTSRAGLRQMNDTWDLGPQPAFAGQPLPMAAPGSATPAPGVTPER